MLGAKYVIQNHLLKPSQSIGHTHNHIVDTLKAVRIINTAIKTDIKH
jgi:hypothetical protein